MKQKINESQAATIILNGIPEGKLFVPKAFLSALRKRRHFAPDLIEKIGISAPESDNPFFLQT